MLGVSKHVWWGLAAVVVGVLVWQVGSQVLLLVGAAGGSYGAWKMRSVQGAKEDVQDAAGLVEDAQASANQEGQAMLAEAKAARDTALTEDYLKPLEFDE